MQHDNHVNVGLMAEAVLIFHVDIGTSTRPVQ